MFTTHALVDSLVQDVGALFYLLIIRSYNLILVVLYNFNYIFSSPTSNLNGTV